MTTAVVGNKQSRNSGWEVIDILAEREDAQGNREVLVVWKPSWIPKTQLALGPVAETWGMTTKKQEGVLLDAQVLATTTSKKRK
jgi:hypothetical protein